MQTSYLNFKWQQWDSNPLRLWTKWLWIWMSLLSLKLQIWHLLWARSFLTFRQTVECGFTLKLIREMIITYSQMHRTDKNSQHSSIIWPVWLNGWVFVYELNDWGFESCYCQLSWEILFLIKSKPEIEAQYLILTTFTLYMLMIQPLS